MVAFTRRGRRETRRRKAAALIRLHVLAFVVVLAALSLPTALGTPSRSDEAALAVSVIWAAAWAGSGTRRDRLEASRPSRAGTAASRRERLGRVLAVGLAVAGGLGLYWLSFLMPTAGPARSTGARLGAVRPVVVVTNEDNPVFLGRVVSVNKDLTLTVDDGSEPAFLQGEGSPTRAGMEVVRLAGVDTSACEPGDLETAVRQVTALALGRLVTVRVVSPVGGPGPESFPGESGSAPAVLAFVYAGTEAYATGVPPLPEEASLNGLAAALLAPAPAVDETPVDRQVSPSVELSTAPQT